MDVDPVGVSAGTGASAAPEVPVLTRSQVNLLLESLSDRNRRQLETAVNDSCQSQSKSSLLQCLCRVIGDGEDGRFVVSVLPSLVPVLLQQMLSDEWPADLLYSSFANALTVAPQLRCHIQRLLRSTQQDPWQPLLDLSQLPTKRRRKQRPHRRQLLSALLAIVMRCPVIARECWCWSSFVALLTTQHDEECLWLAGRIFAVVAGMSVHSWRAWLQNRRISHKSDVTYASRHFPAGDVPTSMCLYQSDGQSEKVILTASDTDSDYACVEGVFLPTVSRGAVIDDQMVLVPGVRDALRSMAAAVAGNKPVLVEGTVGCGKTSLVHHLARRTGRHDFPHIVTVQMGEHIDSKLLLGTYHCTEIPGEFVWQPGCLTSAMIRGQWLLLEDIDCAPNDVLAMLLPVLESRALPACSQCGSINAAPGFQLFATQRLVFSCSDGVPLLRSERTLHSINADRVWCRVRVQSLTEHELASIVADTWPKLEVVSSRLLEVYQIVSSVSIDSLLSTTGEVEGQYRFERRVVSSRDFFKWCSRFGDNFDVSSSDCAYELFQHAYELFCAAISHRKLRHILAHKIGVPLGISGAQVEYFLDSFKPNISLSNECINVGRVSLKMLTGDSVATLSTSSKFSYTRQACVFMERVAMAVAHTEPVLIVGETGVGKTSCVQFLAERMKQKLVVVNLNQQSESGDLLGSYKPVGIKHFMLSIRCTFECLFKKTFDVDSNKKFLKHVMILYGSERWDDMCELVLVIQNRAVSRLEHLYCLENKDKLAKEWNDLKDRVVQIRSRRNRKMALAFSFINGVLVEALTNGWWLLLDEINLASSEMLVCLSGILDIRRDQLTFLESGEMKHVKRHSSFRLFACMNPATDVGKHLLPVGVRNRFTELYFDELNDEADLRMLTGDYLQRLCVGAACINSVVDFYSEMREKSKTILVDGEGHRPNYSLRNLCRALRIAATNSCDSVMRSLYEGLCVSFLTQVDRSSYPLICSMLDFHIGSKISKSVMKRELCAPVHRAVKVSGYWIQQGDLEPGAPEDFILTTSVENNLKDLCRAVSLGDQPVLLQGQTSVGKTSLISYLACVTGNKCVRINNHEHTDIQEYVGSYCADDNGNLVFQEGVLVDALRRGYWIILDELNLAPTDVLEALNRVLDDNRQLYLVETQTNIRAHKRFRLFATQNPPGEYGGRKVLSRAFRNRFIELHFNDIPSLELIEILHKRSKVPNSYCKKMVQVLLDLQLHRQSSNVFQGKSGFITLRDLFRWAERYRLADSPTKGFYDWEQHLADEGYLVIAGRVRREEECEVVTKTLKKHFKRDVSEFCLFSLHDRTSQVTRPLLEKIISFGDLETFGHLVWTFACRRLFVLLSQAVRFAEPALLVGDTGCGKTTICQFLAAAVGLPIKILNCHMHTENSDFIGGLRPIRGDVSNNGGLFEWTEGPLVESMRIGAYFVADEISLADDSVLERFNSVLEPQRCLLLSERVSSTASELIIADEKFRFIGTMNPSGDYGKRELSPSLRNRFTEIWCPPPRIEDFRDIVSANILPNDVGIADKMIAFVEWYLRNDASKKVMVSIRDLLSWVNFYNSVVQSGVDAVQAYAHGAEMIFLDALGCQSTYSRDGFEKQRVKEEALNFIAGQFSDSSVRCMWGDFCDDDVHFGYAPFLVGKKCLARGVKAGFSLTPDTVVNNIKRLIRAMHMPKPVVLEGNPGVGKTSLVCALARATGNAITRINLSEQTDISDLFGADLPCDGAGSCRFSWRDGPLLRALKDGHWVVLDEMNLASQSVLEGLNACLDHRGEIFVPELSRTFHVDNACTRIFACQNPVADGCARKPLPKSFLNRFTQVYVEPLSNEDIECILSAIVRDSFYDIDEKMLKKMVEFNSEMYQSVVLRREFGVQGSPWEFNLRDVTRWLDVLLSQGKHSKNVQALRYLHLIYSDRMRTKEDRDAVRDLTERVFGHVNCRPGCHMTITSSQVIVGGSAISRSDICDFADTSDLFALNCQMQVVESLITCINMQWMPILVGASGCGKSTVVRSLSALLGRRLHVMTMNSAVDAGELLGGFEQVDQRRHLEEIVEKVERHVWRLARELTVSQDERNLCKLSDLLAALRGVKEKHLYCMDQSSSMISKLFVSKCHALYRLLKIIGGKVCDDFIGIVQELESIVTCEGSVSTGGKFEWVDSVLISAMQAGDWLLVDNVNLCQASVLDRLNGLLESDGVLEVTERGLSDEGEIFRVVPHREFRIFLALNPAHGELSRAMRNRGVEIFMDSLQSNYSSHDLDDLFSKCSIEDENIRRLLYKIHEQSGPSSGANSILKAAELTSSLCCFGTPFNRALPEAISRVYFDGDPISSDSACFANLDNKLADHISRRKSTPRFKCANSLMHYMYDADLVLGRLLWSEVSRHLHDSDAKTYVKHAILYSSERALMSLNLFVADEGTCCLQQSLKNITTRVSVGETSLMSSLDLSRNWYCSVDDCDLLTALTDIVVGYVNIDLAYREAADKLLENVPLSTKTSPPLLISLAMENKLMDIGKWPLCVRYLWPMYKMIQELLSIRPPTEKDALRVWLNALPWCERISDLCMKHVNWSESDSWVSIIALHWRWVRLNVITPITSTLNEKSRFLELTSSLNSVFQHYDTDPSNLLLSLSLNFERPCPYVDSERANCFRKLEKLFFVLDVYCHTRPVDELRVDDRFKLFHFLLTPVGRSVLNDLVAAWYSLYHGDLDNVWSNVLPAVQKRLVSVGLLSCPYRSFDVQVIDEKPVANDSYVSSVNMAFLGAVAKTLETQMIPAILRGDFSEHAIHDASAADLGIPPQYCAFKMVLVKSNLREFSQGAVYLFAQLFLDWITSDLNLVFSSDMDCSDSLHSGLVDPHVYSAGVSAALVSSFRVDNSDCCLISGVTIGEYAAHREYFSLIVKVLWKLRYLLMNSATTRLASFYATVVHMWNTLERVWKMSNGENSMSTESHKDSFPDWVIRWMREFHATLQSGEVPDVKQLGIGFTMLGCVYLFILSHLPSVDPVQEKRIAVEYYCDEISAIKTDMRVSSDIECAIFGYRTENASNTQTPLRQLQTERIGELTRKIEESGAKCTWRPPSCKYGEMRQKIYDIITTFASFSAINKVLTSVSDALEGDCSVMKLTSVIQLLTSRLLSFSSVIASFKSDFWAYPDFIHPVVCSVQMVHFGFSTLLLWCQRKLVEIQAPVDFCIRSVLLNLVDWTKFSPVLMFRSQLHSLISTLKCSSSTLSDKWKLNLIDVEVAELRAKLSLIGELDLNHVDILANEACDLWDTEEKQREESARSEEGLYKSKSYSSHDSAVNESENIEIMFPDYVDVVCQDPEPNTDNSTLQAVQSNKKPEFSQHRLYRVFQLVLHSYRHCSTLPWVTFRLETLEFDLDCSFDLRYALFCTLSSEYSTLLDSDDEADLCLAHHIACSRSSSLSPPDVSRTCGVFDDKPYEPYHDTNVTQVALCQRYLEEISSRVDKLLVEFPSNPVLVRIISTLKRVLSFPVSSPLVKVACGVEHVLNVAQLWEEIAHQGVSLKAYLDPLRNLLFTWRKLEIDSWSYCLQACAFHKRVAAVKWMPRLRALFDEYMNDVLPIAELITVLHDFLVKSPLVEFETRLQLILFYHLKLARTSTVMSEFPTPVVCLTWQLHVYFSQFVPLVETRLKSLCSPIEQKVKDFVKLTRWNDSNFWSMKDAVKRSHRVLYKHVRQYESILDNTFESILAQDVVLAVENALDSNFDLSDKTFLVSRNDESELHPACDGSQVLSKLKVIRLRLRRICHKFYLKCNYFDEKQMSDLSTSICEYMVSISTWSIDQSEDRDKRMKEISRMRQRKRQALVELYRSLTDLGLSYRRGLIRWDDHCAHNELILASPMYSTNDSVPAFSECCAQYECKSMFRFNQLKSLLSHPHKEVGIHNLDRIRGFTSDLMSCAVNQRKCLSSMNIWIHSLSSCIEKLSVLSSSSDLPTAEEHWRPSPNTSVSGSQVVCAVRKISDSVITLCHRIKVYLSSAPDYSEDTADILHVHSAPAIVQHGKLSEDCSDIIKKVDEKQTSLLSARRKFACVAVDYNSAYVLCECVKFARILKLHISELISLVDTERGVLHKPFLKYLSELADELNSIEIDLSADCEEVFYHDDSEVYFVKKIERLIVTVQVCAQRACVLESLGSTEDDVCDKSDNCFVRSNIDKFISDLDLRSIIALVKSLVRMLDSSRVSCLQVVNFRCLIRSVLPMLRQYELLCSFAYAGQLKMYRSTLKLLSIVMSVFSNVTVKGFCTPDDFEENKDDSEAGETLRDLQNAGIGEGCGQKDVSDKIESEDQLEQAFAPGQDRDEEANHNIPEEENGIEMTDNFDGTAYDVEGKEEDGDEEDDGDEPDVEKEYGEVGEYDENMVDERLWGSDNESEVSMEDTDGAGNVDDQDPHMTAKTDMKESRRREKVEDNQCAEDEDEQTDDLHNNFPEDNYDNDFELADMLDSSQGNDEDMPEENSESAGDIDQRHNYPDQEEHCDGDEPEKSPSETEVGSIGSGNEGEPDECDGDQDVSESGDMDLDNGSVSADESASDVLEQSNLQQSDNNRGSGMNDTDARLDDDDERNVHTGYSEEHPTEDGKDIRPAEYSEVSHQTVNGDVRQFKQASKPGHAYSLLNRPGVLNNDRAIAEQNDGAHKSNAALTDECKDEAADKTSNSAESNVFQHMKDSANGHDATVYDAATESQLDTQKETFIDDSEDRKADEDMNVDSLNESNVCDQKPTNNNNERSDVSTHSLLNTPGEKQDDAEKLERDIVCTSTVQRPIKVKLQRSESYTCDQSRSMSKDEMMRLREDLVRRVGDLTSELCSKGDAERTWIQFETVIAPLAQDLSEQLRLILEPTRCSKFSGGYRTGKRLNMRKIITYIASQFRKDKIWLRRTCPSKREYQILLAIDDSSSMSDNNSRQLAFESLALVSRAFCLLEAGQLAVLSFGDDTRVLRQFDDPLSAATGAHLLQQLSFSQTRTNMAHMLDRASALLQTNVGRSIGARVSSQLLIVISDGRGLFHEGEQTVRLAAQRVRQSGVFLLFIIVDSVLSQNSVLDHRVVRFSPEGRVLGTDSYLDSFPFPFYMVLRDISCLPSSLSDALRQWFELVAGSG